jgi:hypothetical protein
VSGLAFLELTAQPGSFFRVLLCSYQDQIVGVCLPKTTCIGGVAGSVNFDVAVPKSGSSQLLLHGITIDEKNLPLVIFREAHISATPGQAGRHVLTLAGRGFKGLPGLLNFR